MHVYSEPLARLVEAVFHAAGCRAFEAERIAHYLVESNCVGHPSHGVIRVKDYVAWLAAGKVLANQTVEPVSVQGHLAILDGRFGFGQVLGEEATDLACDLAGKFGLALVGLRNSGHLGRIGDWAERAVARGFLSLHFVNTSGGGILVAPYGGIDRRLSANPIAAGIPRLDGPPVILDLSTSIIAEGKIKVARNRGEPVPPGSIIDHDGQPTTDPARFYGPPPGALLTMAGHKGFALSLLTEVLAGALIGGSCTRPGETRVANNMLSLVCDPNFAQLGPQFHEEVARFFEFVQSSRPATPGGEILLPGEPEARARLLARTTGLELDDTTWAQLDETARGVGLSSDEIARLLAHPPTAGASAH